MEDQPEHKPLNIQVSVTQGMIEVAFNVPVTALRFSPGEAAGFSALIGNAVAAALSLPKPTLKGVIAVPPEGIAGADGKPIGNG